MAIQFEHTIEISRSPEAVFALIEDFSQTPRWLVSCAGFEKVSPGENAVGTKIRFSYRLSAHTGTMQGQITKYVPGERLSFECADHLVGVNADFRMSEIDAGTLLVHEIEIFPKTFLISMVAPLIRSQLPKQTIEAMEKLGLLLEADVALGARSER